jgi:hypothetical protein
MWKENTSQNYKHKALLISRWNFTHYNQLNTIYKAWPKQKISGAKNVGYGL